MFAVNTLHFYRQSDCDIFVLPRTIKRPSYTTSLTETRQMHGYRLIRLAIDGIDQPSLFSVDSQ